MHVPFSHVFVIDIAHQDCTVTTTSVNCSATVRTKKVNTSSGVYRDHFMEVHDRGMSVSSLLGSRRSLALADKMVNYCGVYMRRDQVMQMGGSLGISCSDMMDEKGVLSSSHVPVLFRSGSYVNFAHVIGTDMCWSLPRCNWPRYAHGLVYSPKLHALICVGGTGSRINSQLCVCIYVLYSILLFYASPVSIRVCLCVCVCVV